MAQPTRKHVVQPPCSVMRYLAYAFWPWDSFFLSLFMAVLGLPCCVGLFSSYSKQGLLSSCGAQAPHCCGFSCWGAQALGYAGFSSCNMSAKSLQLLGSRAQAQYLWHMGLVAPRHVGSSRIRDWVWVFCIGRQIDSLALGHQRSPDH